MSRLPQHIRSSIDTLDGAKATVLLLFEKTREQEGQITNLQASLTSTQNELENWRSKFHATDKEKGILDAKLQTTVISEIFKFLASTVAAGIGVNLITSGDIALGIILLITGVVLFVGITYLGRQKNDRG